MLDGSGTPGAPRVAPPAMSTRPSPMSVALAPKRALAIGRGAGADENWLTSPT